MNKRLIILLSLIPLAIGWTWVKPTPQGENIAVMTTIDDPDCARVGKTHVSVKAKLGVWKRNPKKVETELTNLARNIAAADFGGDMVVPLGEVHDGKQTFAVYKCASS
ncbi:MAG: DUF4156 domain-containing protein [Gammaproteobacteria bacterium]|nr:DUF4156 domain-containing protein [Gammaproteobacteria bacterium]